MEVPLWYRRSTMFWYVETYMRLRSTWFIPVYRFEVSRMVENRRRSSIKSLIISQIPFISCHVFVSGLTICVLGPAGHSVVPMLSFRAKIGHWSRFLFVPSHWPTRCLIMEHRWRLCFVTIPVLIVTRYRIRRLPIIFSVCRGQIRSKLF